MTKTNWRDVLAQRAANWIIQNVATDYAIKGWTFVNLLGLEELRQLQKPRVAPANLEVTRTPRGETVLTLSGGWNRIVLTPAKTAWLIQQLKENQ